MYYFFDALTTIIIELLPCSSICKSSPLFDIQTNTSHCVSHTVVPRISEDCQEYDRPEEQTESK